MNTYLRCGRYEQIYFTLCYLGAYDMAKIALRQANRLQLQIDLIEWMADAITSYKRPSKETIVENLEKTIFMGRLP